MINLPWLSWCLCSGSDIGLAGTDVDWQQSVPSEADLGGSLPVPTHLTFFLVQVPDFGQVLGPVSSTAPPQAQGFPTFPESQRMCFIKFKDSFVGEHNTLTFR